MLMSGYVCQQLGKIQWRGFLTSFEIVFTSFLIKLSAMAQPINDRVTIKILEEQGSFPKDTVSRNVQNIT